MTPMRGCSRGSTTSVREVPSASGWPGQSAADAACVEMQSNSPRHNPVHREARTPINPLTTMKHRLHSPFHAQINTARAMNDGLMSEFRTWFPRRLSPMDVDSRAARHQMDDAKVMVAQVAQEGGQHGGGPRFGIVEEDDSLASRVEPPDNQIQFPPRRHRFPVAGPKVGTEHDDAA